MRRIGRNVAERCRNRPAERRFSSIEPFKQRNSGAPETQAPHEVEDFLSAREFSLRKTIDSITVVGEIRVQKVSGAINVAIKGHVAPDADRPENCQSTIYG